MTANMVERISDEKLDELIEQMDSVYSAKVMYGMYPVIPVEDYQNALRELGERRRASSDGRGGSAMSNELIKSLDPFERVFRINEQLNIPDECPLSRCIPGIWPTWGEYKSLLGAAKAMAEREATQ